LTDTSPCHTLALALHRGGAVTTGRIDIRSLVIAGWTGRDRAALETHIAELEALGVKRPATTPVFYRVAGARLTTAAAIEVSGGASSGEVEYLLLKHEGRLWIGVGSDHTDREAEVHGVALSKQMCDKPLAGAFWDHAEVEPHWDRLILRSFIVEDGERHLYQEGSVAAMLAPDDLLARWSGGEMEEGTLMFCGTLVAHGGVRPSPAFEFELDDPVLNRRISHRYEIVELEVAG
jgi:hypothetical protein